MALIAVAQIKANSILRAAMHISPLPCTGICYACKASICISFTLGYAVTPTYELRAVDIDAGFRWQGGKHVALRAQDEERGQPCGVGSQEVEVPGCLAQHEAFHAVLQLTWDSGR